MSSFKRFLGRHKFLLGLNASLTLGDVVTTVFGSATGRTRELNPLWSGFLERGEYAAFSVLRMSAEFVIILFMMKLIFDRKDSPVFFLRLLNSILGFVVVWNLFNIMLSVLLS
jgi:hypothetical protein